MSSYHASDNAKLWLSNCAVKGDNDLRSGNLAWKKGGFANPPLQQHTYSTKSGLFTAVTLLLLMAAILIPGLNHESLWGDEGWSVHFTNGASLQDVTLALTQDRHPPFYFLLLRGWRSAAGDDEIPLRMLAVFAGLLSGAVMYRLGKALYGQTAGVFALLIFALMDKQVVFSQEVRHYSWFILWTAAASWALARWLQRDQPRPRDSLLLVACVTGGLYTHSLMVIVLMSHGLYALLTVRSFKRLVRLGVLYFLAVLAFTPWLMVSWYQYLTRGGITPSMPLEWRSVEILAPQFLGRPVTLTLGLLLLGAVSPFFSWFMGRSRAKISFNKGLKPLVSTGCTDPLRANAVLLPVLIILLPIALVLLLTGDKVTLLNDRNLSMLLPAIALLIGLGMTMFTGFARAALVIFLLVNGLLTTDADMHNPPWRPISRYLATHAVPGQPVIRDVGGADAALAYHLAQEFNTDVPQASVYEMAERREIDPGFEPLTVMRFETLADADGFWYVFWGKDETFLNAFPGWGFTKTATANDVHFGDPIYMYRYDRTSILDESRARYGDTITLHRFYAPREAHPGESVHILLWWSVVQPVQVDYTISVFLMDADGILKAQHDGFPQDGLYPTSAWTPNTLAFDTHTIPIPGNLPPGIYQIGVKVYNGEVILPTEDGTAYFSADALRINE